MGCKIAHEALLASGYLDAKQRITELEKELADERGIRRRYVVLPSEIDLAVPPISQGGALDVSNESWQFPGETGWVWVPCRSEQEFDDRVAHLYEQAKWHTEGYPVEGKECLVTVRLAERSLLFTATARHYDHDDWSGWRASFGPVEWGKWEVLAWREMPEPWENVNE